MSGVTDEVVVDVADGVLELRLDRPARKNAITVAMYAAMADALQRAEDDPAVRAVLLCGHEAVFTSGNDIADFRGPLPPEEPGVERPVARFLRLISTMTKPVVAAVTGPAVGIGTTMLLHCDLVYAGEGARLQLPFVNLGLVPEAASSLLLPAALGHRRAAELLLLGEPFSAEKARDYGIVTAVVPDAEVFDVAAAAARRLADQPPTAVRLSKQLLRGGQADAVAARMAEENVLFRERLSSPEAKEAFAAFAEKRAPDFTPFLQGAPS